VAADEHQRLGGSGRLLARPEKHHRLRFGVAGIGSIPVCVLVLIVCALITARVVSLKLQSDKSELKVPQGGKESPVKAIAKLYAGSTLESAWTLGLNVIGTPLLLI
jgi:hypothetical protein